MTLSATGRTSLRQAFAGPNSVGDGDAVFTVLNAVTGDTSDALNVTPASASGNAVDIIGASITTGKAVDISDLDAITTGTAVHIDATGVTQTSGKLLHIDSASTALTSAGRLLLVDHTGASGVSNINSEFKSAATDETVIVKVNAAAALAAGTALQVSASTMATGSAITASDLDALTTGKGVHVASAATAITTTGRLLLVDHTGATGASAVLSEFASAATDETVIVKITASAALAAGVALQLSGAAVTTGTLISCTDANALTTGGMMNLTSNSADTGTRSLLKIVNDNTAATGTTGLTIQNDATSGAHIALTGTGILGIDFTALTSTDCIFNCTAGTGCTAAPQTNAAVGFINIRVGGTQQWIPYYNAT